MRSVKLRTPALAAAVLALLTATVPAAGAAPAGRATATTTAWRIQPTPNPKIPQGRLNAVSCSSPRTCTAVGVFDNIPGRGTLAERWDGTSWSIQASANPAGALTAVLFGVSCPAATFCVAVGNYQNRTGRHAILAEAWNGSSWSVLPAPPPAGARRSFLNGVSCVSATACTAVGSYQTGAGQHVTLAERWNGTTWSRQPTPNPAAPPRSALAAVSCTSASACTAVGTSVDDSGGNPRTLAERWNSTTWSIQPTPTTSGSSPQLNSVSCASPSACIAVGGRAIPGGAFAERWDGSSWSIQLIQGIHDNAALNGVSCPAASACIAVGYDLEVTLGEAWDGTSWSVEPTPNPPSTLGTHRLTSVSCTSPSFCMAVGLTPKGLSSITLAERWNGTRWTIVPTPTRGEITLSGVSCTSPSACIAVGSSVGGGVLSERWDGTRWSLLTTPNPVHLGQLLGVSCASASACVAVGSSSRLTLAEVWNGTSWKVQPTPNPAKSIDDALLGVSCTAPTACTAVGVFTLPRGQFSLAERWDGTSWSIQPTPALPAPDIPRFGGVSCTSASACIAVGTAAATLAEVGDGTAWSIDPTPPSPPSLAGIGGLLDGVSCTSATSCTAVGGWFNSGEGELTLAEARS